MNEEQMSLKIDENILNDAMNVVSEDIKPGITTEEAVRRFNALMEDLDIKENEDERQQTEL